MNSYTSGEYGTFLLRISLGVIMLAHSAYLKLFIFTLPGTAQFFASLGLPQNMAYFVFTVEVLGGVALILGIYTPYVALALVPVALGATWAHFGSGWIFSNQGGGWEYPLFLAVTLVVQAFLGSGAYTLRSAVQTRGKTS